jgi:5-methylcytosine-specific restriction endonuclease McrA
VRSHAGDPKAKAKRDLIRAKRRRAATRGDADPERIDPLVVAERDGWTCWLCDELVDPDVKWPDVRCRSIDHVMPLSKGGLHRYANVRLAHFICNVRHGNRCL